jgi:long-chain acyl-CoA synthetase
VDRLSDLVHLVNGETLAPQSIEGQLRFSPFVRDAWVLGGPDGAYTSAIIIIDRDGVGDWAAKKKVAYENFAELSQNPEIRELVGSEIRQVNEALSPGARVKRFVILHKEFDPDEAELTRTRNLRRAVVKDRYRKLIDAIYSDQAEVSIEAEVRYRDGRMRTVKTTLMIGTVEEAV